MSDWSKGRLKSFITSALRGAFRRYPTKFVVLNKAKKGKKLNKLTKRIAEHYECAKCKKHFPLKQVQVDHIKPIVDRTIGFTTWDNFIAGLFCEESNLQVLCKSCHSKKTKLERKK